MYSITTAEQPAIDDAERFVRALFEGYEDEGLACIIDVLLKPNPKRPGKFLWTSKNENYYPMPGRMDDLLGDLLGLIKSHPERDVYICTQLLKDRSRKKESSKKLRVAWAEFDAGEDLPEGMPPPSIIVESSPGHFHAYWLLDEECDPFAVEALNRGIAYRFEADMGGWDLSQVLRVPGTLNHKYPDSPEVRLLKLAPELVYTYEELAEQAPPIKEETHPLEDLDNGETREDEARALLGLIVGKVRPNILETIEEGWESYTPREGGDDSRSAADAAVVSALLGAGLTPTQIRTIYQHYPVGTEGKYSERGDKYLKLTIKEMRAWRRDKLGKVPAPTDELSPNGSSENHRHHNHDPYRGDDCDDDASSDDGLVWASEMGAPQPQEYLLKPLIPKPWPIVCHGSGGSAKSYAMLDLALRYTNVGGDWWGMPLSGKGRALYVDFELNSNEFNRRLKKLANGMGFTGEIKNIAYFGAGDQPTKRVFNRVRALCRKHKFDLVIIDSVGPALDGDAGSSTDVLSFHRNYITPLRLDGVVPVLIDHQGRAYSAEEYQLKGAYGNSYKEHMARSIVQFQPEPQAEESDTLKIRVRHKKANFSGLVKPFDVWITFGEDAVVLERRDVPDAELLLERTMSMRSRIRSLLTDEDAFADTIAERLDENRGSVQNTLTRMRKDGEVEEKGREGQRILWGLPSRVGNGQGDCDEGEGKHPVTDDVAEAAAKEDERHHHNHTLYRDYDCDDGWFSYVTTLDQLADATSKMSEATLVGVDLETVGTDPATGTLRLVQVSDGEMTFVVDAFMVDPKPLLELVSTKEIVAHNALFELSWLKTLYDLEPGKVHDTMLMSQVIYAGKIPPHEHGLLEVAKRELGVELDKSQQQSDWAASTLTQEQLSYAALDARILPELYHKLKEAAKDA